MYTHCTRTVSLMVTQPVDVINTATTQSTQPKSPYSDDSLVIHNSLPAQLPLSLSVGGEHVGDAAVRLKANADWLEKELLEHGHQAHSAARHHRARGQAPARAREGGSVAGQRVFLARVAKRSA